MEYRASIRVFSEQFTVNKLNALIGLNYDEKHDMGEPRAKGLKITFNENMWMIKSKLSSDKTLDLQIEEILERLAPVKPKLKLLSKNFDIVCQCIVEGEESPILNFPKSILDGLSDIGAGLDIDLYITNAE